MNGDRERRISAAFVSIANSLAEGCDAVDLCGGLAEDCTYVLDFASAGLLLADERGVLHVVAGFASVHAVPMRLRDTLLGTLGLFHTKAGALSAEDLELAQALAHVAAVALVAGRTLSDATAINDQLQTALRSRVVLEQAKGVLAERGRLEMTGAFAALRGYARDHSVKLGDVAQRLVSRELAADLVLDHVRSRSTHK